VRARLTAQLSAVTLATALALPAAALATSSNPLAPGLPQPSATIPTTPTPTTTTSSTSGSGLSGSSTIVIAIGALVLIGGIAMFIWRDARRRAPVRHAHATAGVGARSGSKRPVKPRRLSAAERRRRKRGRAR
jgi:hypothetical protein